MSLLVRIIMVSYPAENSSLKLATTAFIEFHLAGVAVRGGKHDGVIVCLFIGALGRVDYKVTSRPDGVIAVFTHLWTMILTVINHKTP